MEELSPSSFEMLSTPERAEEKNQDVKYTDGILIRRKTTIFNKILGEMKARADDIRAELEDYWPKGGDYNPKDYPIETVFEEADGQLDMAHRKNRILAKGVKVLLDEFGTRKHSIQKIDSQRKGQKVKKKEL